MAKKKTNKVSEAARTLSTSTSKQAKSKAAKILNEERQKEYNEE